MTDLNPVDAMTTDYRAMCAELHTAIQLYTGQNPAAANVSPSELVCRLMDAMAASAAALDQPEPPELTDEELLEIRDGAYCPSADEVNDEDDSMWQYTSNYISWLYDQGTVEEQQQYEAKGLRAVFNAGRRTRLP